MWRGARRGRKRQEEGRGTGMEEEEGGGRIQLRKRWNERRYE